MTHKPPILDDNKRSPHWSRHQPQDTPDTPQPTSAPRVSDRSPARTTTSSTGKQSTSATPTKQRTSASTPGTGKQKQRTSVSTSSTDTKYRTSTASTSKKTGSAERAWMIVILIAVAACVVAGLIRAGRISIPSLGLAGDQSTSATASPTFSVYSFMNSLQEGDCFTLEVSPSFSGDGTFIEEKFLHGEKVACDDARARYRFTSKETGVTDGTDEVKDFDGNRYMTFKNGDRFNFVILARDGTFLIIEWETADQYIFISYYLPDGYTLPAEAQNTGLIQVSTHGYGSCTDGRTVTIDGQETCWTLTDTRSRPQ